MNAVRLELRKVATLSAVISLGTFAAILFAMQTPTDLIVKSLLKGGAALSVTGLFWEFYNRRGWRWRGFRLFGWLSPYPDLNGRWEGTVIRKEDGDVPRPFVLEVTQTFTSLNFRTFSRNSRGSSAGAWLTCNEERTVFGVVAHWQTTTKKRYSTVAEETFSGTSIWRLEFTDNPGDFDDRIRIVDDYYTNRNPPTAGRLEVRRVSRKLRNSFE